MPDNSKLSPYLFTVEIDGIETARFQKCEGLEAETETFEFEEGGGHIITQIFNGPGEQINQVPQAQTLNRGDWKAMENDVKKLLYKNDDLGKVFRKSVKQIDDLNLYDDNVLNEKRLDDLNSF